VISLLHQHGIANGIRQKQVGGGNSSGSSSSGSSSGRRRRRRRGIGIRFILLNYTLFIMITSTDILPLHDDDDNAASSCEDYGGSIRPICEATGQWW